MTPHNTSSDLSASVRKITLRIVEWVEPASLFVNVKRKRGLLWLDSGAMSQNTGRWSYIMWNPVITISGVDNRYCITRKGENEYFTGDPFDRIENILASFKVEGKADAPDFTGGAAGFFGYRLLTHCEPSTKLRKAKPPDEGDLWLGFYDRVIAFDHQEKRVVLIVNHDLSEDPARHLDKLEIVAPPHRTPPPKAAALRQKNRGISSNFTKEKYLDAVARVKKYIEEGDAYQVNISQRFTSKADIDPATCYLRLRSINPAPYAAYMDTGSAQILSSSPERFIRLIDGVAQTRPIKGTRPRGDSPMEDQRLAHELEASQKDRAENVMIVDLMRNDLSKVCQRNSVKVTELCAIEKYPTLYHLTSTVEGRLKEGLGPIDLLKNIFPAGSVTGAPKIRAMEIIDELEPDPRGVYCGSIGYLGFSGSLDLSVAIRTITLAKNVYSFSAGGGVTYSSIQEDEYQETLDKARALIDAISAGGKE